MAWSARVSEGLAVAVLCLVAGAGVLSTAHQAVHHADACDIAATSYTHHDASAHAIGPHTGDADQPLHCVLCHSMRVFRSRPLEQVQVVATYSTYVRPVAPPVRLLAGFLDARPPLRAPPSPAIHA